MHSAVVEDGWTSRTSATAADQWGSSALLFFHQFRGCMIPSIPSALARKLGNSDFRFLKTDGLLKKEKACRESTVAALCLSSTTFWGTKKHAALKAATVPLSSSDNLPWKYRRPGLTQPWHNLPTAQISQVTLLIMSGQSLHIGIVAYSTTQTQLNKQVRVTNECERLANACE